MKIKVDEEARQALTTVCDLALKAAGVQALSLINAINQSTTSLEDDDSEAEEDG